MDLGLNNKVAIVTGGTKGIGAGIVRAMAAEGAIVVCVNRDGKEGPELVREITGKGQQILYIPAELTEVSECKRVVEETKKAFGRIDIIINNAGGNNQLGLSTEPDAFLKGMRDNIIHYYALVHYAYDELIKNKGNIVNIGSKVSITGQGETSAYAAAKGACNALTREWAAHFSDKGVRVNCLLPSEVWTNSYAKWVQTFPDPEARKKLATDKIPFGRRFTTVEEFADMVVFVASERASHLTGELIVNDGGYAKLDRALT